MSTAELVDWPVVRTAEEEHTALFGALNNVAGRLWRVGRLCGPRGWRWVMAEHTEADDEERAWALAQARAFLAPPAPLVPLPPGEGPRPAAVVAVVVVPVPPEARGDEAMRRRGDAQEQEGDGDG